MFNTTLSPCSPGPPTPSSPPHFPASRYFRTICVLLVLLSPLVLALTLMWMLLSPLLLLVAVAALRPRMSWRKCGLVIAYPVVVMLVIGGCIPDDPLDDSSDQREEVDPFESLDRVV